MLNDFPKLDPWSWSVGDRLALSKNHALHLFRLLGWRLVGLVGLVDCTGWCLLEAVSCMRCERGATWLWKWRNILGFVSHVVLLVRNKRKLTVLPRPDCALLWSVCKPGIEPPTNKHERFHSTIFHAAKKNTNNTVNNQTRPWWTLEMNRQ
jgi:hypothetical protein